MSFAYRTHAYQEEGTHPVGPDERACILEWMQALAASEPRGRSRDAATSLVKGLEAPSPWTGTRDGATRSRRRSSLRTLADRATRCG